MRKLKLLVMKSAGTIAPFIMTDIAESFERLGHAVLTIDFAAEGLYAGEKAGKAISISERIRSFAPDFALSYGCGGLITLADGVHLFEALKIPYLLMFYDAPFGLDAKLASFGSSPLLRVLCWDRRYFQLFKSFGAERLLWQPLGTNLRTFGAAQASGAAAGISFVGSLPLERLARGLPGSPPLQAFAKSVLELKMASPCRPARELFDEAEGALPPEAAAPFREFRKTPGFAAYMVDVICLADALYRREALMALSDKGPSVYGNDGWKSAAIPSLDYRGQIEYGPKLAEAYASSAVNLNLSNCHLESAVNQRVFDCPAAGGFLLTDYRADLEELFDPGTELAVFRNIDEMRELAGRFASDEPGRRRIAEAARRRVFAGHGWDSRTAALASWLDETR